MKNYQSPEIERRTQPASRPAKKTNSLWGNLFSVYSDPRTWGALLYIFVSLITGFIYFSWTFLGISFSLIMMILIIGRPVATFFLISEQGLVLLESRLVEVFLGVRIPRRPLFAQLGLKWMERLKVLLNNKRTWLSMLYMLILFPLGWIYFIPFFLLIGSSLVVVLSPIFQIVFNYPLITIGTESIFLPIWALILLPIGGVLLMTLTLHLARQVGWLHSRYAKWMLVTDH